MQLVALLSSTKKVMGSYPGHDLLAWSLHALLVHAWVYTGFLPQSGNMVVRSICVCLGWMDN